MAIEKLALVDEVSASTYFAVNLNGQDYRVSASEIVDFVSGNLSATDSVPQFVTQYAAPNATGFSVSITNAGDSVHLILTPTAGFAAGTIVLPALANCTDKQRVLVNTTQSVTTLTINGNGATVTGAPTTLAANAFFMLKFDDVTNVWYRIS